MHFALTLLLLAAVLALTWRYLGSYLEAVYSGRVGWLSRVEGVIYRLLGVDPSREQRWRQYAVSLVVFSGVSLLLTYGLLRLQGQLPLNPQHLPAASPLLSWNTAVSFITNTNWQNYAGETTMSYFSQVGALMVQQFVSAAVGIAVAVALVRGFARRGSSTIGNFWVDITRTMLYLLVPIAFLTGVVFVAQGAVQTFAGPATVHDVLNGVTQVIARGPAAFMESIKQLGTNGGGFFNANSAMPLENPTGLTNFLSIYLVLAIPVALTYTFGKMVGSVRHGVALVSVMILLFGAWASVTIAAEHQNNPAVAAAGVTSHVGNTVGKEVRFGDTSSALFAVASTQTSTGSADASYDSFTPLGGLGLMSGMMMGEVTPGGVGSGLYTLLIYAIIAVFIGGLMIGRTPEYLGKKIQAREVKLAGLAALVMPLAVLIATALAVSTASGRAGPLNAGPHGFSEILYAFTSQGNNNGSAFAGLSGNTPFYNVVGAIDMLIGRFAIIVPVLALAGSLAAQGAVPESLGTFRTDNGMFVGLTIGVVLIIGGLTFFPAVALGPVVEQLAHGRFF